MAQSLRSIFKNKFATRTRCRPVVFYNRKNVTVTEILIFECLFLQKNVTGKCYHQFLIGIRSHL